MSQGSREVPPADAGQAGALPDAIRGRGGLAAAAGAFAIWGLLPLYLRALDAVPPLQLVAHRVAWACLFVLIVIALRGELAALPPLLRRPGVLARLCAAAALLSVNWLVYVWSVAAERVVETSLGYFINPLVNVLLGVMLLHERLNRLQWSAVTIAAAGVLWLTLTAGRPPWIALSLALTFGLYGFIRKTIAVDSLPGLAIETSLLAPLAVGWLLWCQLSGSGALGAHGVLLDLLMIASGAVTAIPLFLFAYGARRLPYSTVGILQYIGPSMQLGTAVFLFHEPFGRSLAIGFACIWTALAIYAVDGWQRSRAR